MGFMNEYDLHFARQRFTSNNVPNRLALVIVVERLREWADDNSDGWAYWQKPLRAAQNAIALIESRTARENDEQERVDITEAEMLAAVRPIKAFLTRQAKEKNRFGNPRVSPEQRELILRSTRPMFEVL